MITKPLVEQEPNFIIRPIDGLRYVLYYLDQKICWINLDLCE